MSLSEPYLDGPPPKGWRKVRGIVLGVVILILFIFGPTACAMWAGSGSGGVEDDEHCQPVYNGMC